MLCSSSADSGSDGKLSVSSSFETVTGVLGERSHAGAGDPALSRSTTSSSFAHHSWADEPMESNSNPVMWYDETHIGREHLEADQSGSNEELVGDDDSTLGVGIEGEQFIRILAKFFILALIVAWLIKVSVYPDHVNSPTNSSVSSAEQIEQLHFELNRQLAERWELERELATMKQKFEVESERRSEADKEIRKVHERLEMDLRIRIQLQMELEKVKVDLMEAEEKVADAERRMDEKWMGSGFGELTRMYRLSKEREWLNGNLRETSEWWVPLYWRVVRVTFFRER